MYPTAIAGCLLVVNAWRFAFTRERARLSLAVWLGVLTALVGSLGFISGAIKTLISAGQLPPNETVGVVAAGLGESACNLGLALVTMVFGALGIAVGHSRRPSELVDPHV
jgi:hypothetical protein